MNAERLAAAVAASIEHPADALYLVRQARNEPDKALGQIIDTSKVAAILTAVRTAQETPSKEYEITDSTRAAAIAAGVNPRLVAAACELWMGQAQSSAPPDPDPSKNSFGWNGRRWAINFVDPAIIDRAVRAFVRARSFEILSVGEDLRLAVERIVSQVSKLESTDAQVREELKVIKAKVDGAAPNPGVGGGGPAGGGGGGGPAGGGAGGGQPQVEAAGAGAGPGAGAGGAGGKPPKH